MNKNLDKILRWVQANSLWYYFINHGCCADEVLRAKGCRYDIERFGCINVDTPEKADLLIVGGVVTEKLKPYLLNAYEKMITPKFVMAVGACACRCGFFQEVRTKVKVYSVDQIIPVDVFVPGCPPRPEAIQNGLISLQNKIIKGNIYVQ